MKKKILIVEDNELIASIYETALKNDYDLFMVCDPLEAINHITSYSPDLIIMDIMMPGLDGYQLCSDIKKNDDISHIPVIFATAKVGSRERTLGYEFGVINYIEKPFDITELRSIIRSTLNYFKATSERILYKDINIDLAKNKVFVAGEYQECTRSEYLLLLQFVRKPNEIFTREQLLEILSHGQLDSSDRSIDSHISTLRKKLNKSQTEIKTKYGHGYFIS